MPPGTEVDIHTENEKAVVEPEVDPEQVLERMEQLLGEIVATRGETTPLDGCGPPLQATTGGGSSGGSRRQR